MPADEKPSLFRKWMSGFGKGRGPEVMGLNLSGDRPAPNQPMPSERQAPLPRKEPQPVNGVDTLIGHRHVHFANPRTNKTILGHPVKFMPGMRNNGIEPGSRNSQGVPGIWVNDMEISGRVDWIDDPQLGLFSRKISNFIEVIGSIGTIEGAAYSFEAILQVGRNVAIYQLSNLATGGKAVLGMGRDEFDPIYGLVNHLKKIGEGHLQPDPQRIVWLCDLVLEDFPENETALFNKGVFLMAQKDYVQSNACFEKLVELNLADQFTALHYAATLASIGKDDLALENFSASAAVSEEQCRTHLASLNSIRDPLEQLLVRILDLNPEHHEARHLWLTYCTPDIDTIS